MKKIILLMIISIIITIGCIFNKKTNENINKLKAEEIYQGDTTSDIAMTIKEGTLTNSSATVIIKDLSKKRYEYNDAFSLYVKKDNNWLHLYPIAEDEIIVKGISYGGVENSLLELDQYWGNIWGNLQSGEYKLVKSASLVGEDKDYTFSVDFTIN